jgi:hypothetical protein
VREGDEQEEPEKPVQTAIPLYWKRFLLFPRSARLKDGTMEDGRFSALSARRCARTREPLTFHPNYRTVFQRPDRKIPIHHMSS